jgi:hypothetical protein
VDRPDFATAVVDPRKLTDYLLATGHPEGGAKAIFFRRCGFSPDAADGFAAALKAQAARAALISEETGFGVKYVADGPILDLDGQERLIRTVWIVETLAGPPRFVTAYPLEGRRGAR